MTRIKTWALAVVAGLLMASGMGWSPNGSIARADAHTDSPAGAQARR
jgi:hypothetical protein